MASIYFDTRAAVKISPYGHSFLIYIDDAGNEEIIRAGPDGILDSLVTYTGDANVDAAGGDWDGSLSPTAVETTSLIEGSSGLPAEIAWGIMQQSAVAISDQYEYDIIESLSPSGTISVPTSNSNAVILSVLNSVHVSPLALQHVAQIHPHPLGSPGLDPLPTLLGPIHVNDDFIGFIQVTPHNTLDGLNLLGREYERDYLIGSDLKRHALGRQRYSELRRSK
jgi:hypothetical protein